MEVDSTYDELCHCLVKHQSQLKQKWKFAHGKKSDCVLCTVTEGPLLKCRQDRCENYLHIDCAASTTALYFDEENAMLTCWCESHFEPILFCSCKTPYDECKPMVYCDECCEWYHHSCEKLTDDVNDQEHYMCTSCTKLSLRASRVSDEIREKNRTKDVLYAQCNAGLSIANIWQSIDTEFCSKIDIVSKILHDEQAISKAEFDSVLHILEAMATANKDDSAMDTEESTPSGSEEMTGWKDLARALGEQSLVATWRQQLVDFNTELVIFNQDVQNLTHKLTQYFSTQFHNPSHDMIIEMSNLIRNMKEMCHNKLRIIVEVELGCTAFEENFEWMKEFMKLLHGLTTSDRWLATLKTHCRKVNTILRGLEEIKVEAMWFEYANWFAEYVQTAVSNTEKIVYWCNQWSAISKGGSTTYENLLALHEAASAFPIRIVFVEMLESWINKCKTFDEKILHLAKNHTELDQSMFEALKEERSNLSIVLTTDWLYSSLNQYFIFHAAYHLAMADARVEKDSLDVLIAAANDVLGMWQEVGSDMILIPSLKSKVEASAQVINKLLEESDAVVANIPRDDFDQMEKIGSLLPQLSVLRVITAEEKFILMVQDFQECVNKAQAILSRSSSIPITEVQANLDEFLKLYNMQITGEFMTLSSKRSVMRKNIASLNEIISQANQQWKSIEMAVDELTNGKSITLEYLQELMLQVQGLQISHPEIEAKVQQAIEKGQEVEAACDKLLTQSSHDVEAQHMEEVLAMLKTIQHHVISSKVSKLVRSRYDAFHLYQTCQDLLKQHSLTTDGAILPPKELIPLFQSVAKDLLKVEAFVEDKDCIEHQILAKIAAPILTTHWYIEVEAIMQSKEKIPFSHSQDLLNLAKERLSNTGIAQSAAYSSLSKDVLNFEQLKQEMHTVLVAFDTWNESTLLANIPEGLKQIAIQEPTQLFATVDQLQAFLSTQKDSIMEHHNQTKTIMDKVISESKFTDDKVEEIGALMNYCHFLYLSFVTVSKLHENYHREADPTGKEQSNVDMKHIVELLNCQKAFTSMKTPSMRYDLSKLLTEVYTHLQHATTIWIASKQEWMMLKQARNKQKIPEGGSAPVRVSINQMDIVAALNEGIAKMIRTPQHDRMVAVLLEIECIHQRLLHLLAPGLEGPKINDTESKVAIDDDLDEVSMFEEQVGDLLENLKSIREELSLIPVDTCDTHVIQYITQVLTWMASVPHPDDHESSQIIRMIEAKKKIAEASPIISEIEVSTINRLIEFGLMNEEGFIAQAHPFLKKAVDFLTHLEQSVERCQAYQEKLSLLLKSNEKIEVLEALLSEKLQLVVIPETDLVRNLEKEIALKKPKQVVPSKEVSHSTAVGHSASATAITKSKSRHLCLANCGNGIRPQLSIAYCSDRCMKNHAEKMMLSLLEYRYILHDFYHQQKDFSVTTMPTTNLSKRGREDMNAFDLADIAEVPSTRKEDQQMKNFLDLIYLDDRWSIGDISLKATVSQDHQKKGAFLDRMAIRLPKAASFISPLGKDPQAKIDMRLKTRLLLEDLFVSILHKTETPSSAFLGVLVAMEVEEGLFDKYSSNGKNLEKAGLQQYQKHIQMLMTNLRQPHNEHYVSLLHVATFYL